MHIAYLQHYEQPDVEEALKHTLFSVVVWEGSVPVGIGRVVGDGRIVFFIKDVVVEPSRQNRGIGHIIMGELMHYIKQNGCQNAYAGPAFSAARYIMWKNAANYSQVIRLFFDKSFYQFCKFSFVRQRSMRESAQNANAEVQKCFLS